MSQTDLGKMKGYPLRSFFSWFEEEWGRERVLASWERMTPSDREHFDLALAGLGISGTAWYPLTTIHRTLDAFTSGMTRAEVERVGYHGGEATVRGMTRGAQSIIFSLFVTPERYGAFVGKLWRLTYDHGTCEHRVHGPHHDETVILDWRGHHPLACHMTCAAKAYLYRYIGCRDVRFEHRCVSRGHSACAAIVRWSE